MNLLRMICLLVLIINSGCSFSQTSREEHKEDDYQHLKSKFDSSLISHFPTRITTDDEQQNFMIAYTAIARHNIGLFLYEYRINLHKLDSIENYFVNNNVINYYTYNNCLLIVNRFETKYTFENDIKYQKIDTILSEKPCYNQMLPIPKFIDFAGKTSTKCGLDSTFTIYVIEAKPGIYFDNYQQKPFEQMPKEWGNGYSKGIAISKKEKTIIYWSIIW